jgi:hypothetical protein
MVVLIQSRSDLIRVRSVAKFYLISNTMLIRIALLSNVLLAELLSLPQPQFHSLHQR